MSKIEPLRIYVNGAFVSEIAHDCADPHDRTAAVAAAKLLPEVQRALAGKRVACWKYNWLTRQLSAKTQQPMTDEQRDAIAHQAGIPRGTLFEKRIFTRVRAGDEWIPEHSRDGQWRSGPDDPRASELWSKKQTVLVRVKPAAQKQSVQRPQEDW